MTRDMRIEQAEKITQELWPVISKALGGRSPEVQGAVLADLTAIWIAGHLVADDPVESNQTRRSLARAKLRDQLLAVQVSTIRELIEMYVGRR